MDESFMHVSFKMGQLSKWKIKMGPKNENKVNKNQKNSILVETEVITNLTGKEIPVPI